MTIAIGIIFLVFLFWLRNNLEDIHDHVTRIETMLLDEMDDREWPQERP